MKRIKVWLTMLCLMAVIVPIFGYGVFSISSAQYNISTEITYTPPAESYLYREWVAELNDNHSINSSQVLSLEFTDNIIRPHTCTHYTLYLYKVIEAQKIAFCVKKC